MSLRLRSSILVLSLASLVPALAHADTYVFASDLNVNNGAGNPLGAQLGTASGTVNYDPASGLFTGANFTVSYLNTTTGVTSDYHFTTITSQGNFATYTSSGAATSANSVDFLDGTGDDVFFQLTLPQGFTSGNVCSGTNTSGCLVYAGQPYYYNTSLDQYDGTFTNGTPNFTARLEVASDGTLTPTPEPSSIAMLGTGLAAITGVARRRFRK